MHGRLPVKKVSIVPTFLLSVALMLGSLLYVHSFGLPDYNQFNYGYPLPWLIHGVSLLVFVSNNWWLEGKGTGMIIDYFFWLGISFTLIEIVSTLWNRIGKKHFSRHPRTKEPTIPVLSL
ncbi:MAG: hypothetical protein M1368_05445 [Thaumarchaeota archaeon]|nr:hypothetical protein [Nitrososphaerota archaeon]